MKIRILLFTFLLVQAFQVSVTAQVPDRKGWWKFDDPAELLKAQTGAPLEMVGTLQAADGPVAGNKAVLIPAGNYLLMRHNLPPNGGGTMVNEYSLQIDFSVPETGIWHSFFQTDPANGNDAELFTNASNSIGVMATGYSAKGIASGTWYRMIISVRNGEFFRIYLDGSLLVEGAAQALDSRFALADRLLMFADNDGEDGNINCSELGIWDVALTEEQAHSLGGATGERVPGRTIVGKWKFDDPENLLKAETGNPLTAIGSVLTAVGPEAGDDAIQVSSGSYLELVHGILPNGGGQNVNEYSLLIDFLVPQIDTWYAFLQTNVTNGDDADLFIAKDQKIGTQQTGYTIDKIAANTWYRMVVSVKNGSFFRIYINGELWLDAPGQAVDDRFSLAGKLLLFADNDGEDGTILCSQIGIWEVALNDAEVEDLGVSPGSQIPEMRGWWKFEDPNNIGKAETGNDLVKTGTVNSVSGPAAGNLAAELGVGSYFTMPHGMYGNGDGYMVNDYTLMIDFMVPQGETWHAFFQTDPGNAGDADLFTNKSNAIGTAATSYTSKTISPNTWYRMTVTVKNGQYFRMYMNGELWLNASGQPVDGRFALADNLLLFADDDGDDGLIHCAEVRIWDLPLSQDQVILLGKAGSTPVGIAQMEAGDTGLSRNYPNPFSGTTVFHYQITNATDVRFTVVDLTGREMKVIREGKKPAGRHTFELSSANLRNGIYLVKMSAEGHTSVRKVIVNK